MNWLDRLLAPFRSPADRRLERAMAAAFSSSPQPAAPFANPSLGSWGAPRSPIPPIDWAQDQPVPAGSYSYQPGYDDRLFRSFATPVNYEGFTLQRIRAAVAAHRLGIFYDSFNLCVALMGFAPILAALQQAIAPILDLDRRVRGGTRGLSRDIADELREALIPAASLVPSPYFPPTLLATSIIYQRMMGFSVLQHADGDPDPVTGVRPRYTRVWEPWAVQCNPSPLKWLALTTEGPIEIGTDSHFTLVADQMRPHLMGAVVPLGEEGFAGKLTQVARNQWIEKNGQIKWIATLPEKVPTHGPEGDDFLAAVAGISAPDGLGIFPYGSTFDAVALTRDTSGAFNDALSSIIAHVGMVLVGSPGPIISGAEGVYQAGTGGKWNVRQDFIDQPTIAFCRAFNQGHVVPYCEGNYAEEIAGAKRAGTWVQPAYEILLDDPEANARIASVIEREEARCRILEARKKSGMITTQDDFDAISISLDLPMATLAVPTAQGAASFGYDQENGVLTINQRLAELGLPPDMTGRGAMTIPQYKAWLETQGKQEEIKTQAEADVAVADATAPPATAAEPVPIDAEPPTEPAEESIPK